MDDISVVIRQVMADKKYTQVRASKVLGIATQSMTRKMNSGNWTVKELVAILDDMGCRLVIESGQIKKFQF